MAYEYIQRAYGKTPKIGGLVFHTVTKNYGTITREDRSNGHYVQVRFEGRKFSLPCHPDELQYDAVKPKEDCPHPFGPECNYQVAAER